MPRALPKPKRVKSKDGSIDLTALAFAVWDPLTELGSGRIF